MGLQRKLAGFVAPSKDKAYFFLGDAYVRYDVEADRADDGYPMRIADHWPGLFTEDIDAALVWPDGNVYFFRGEEYLLYDWAADRAADGYPVPISATWPGLFEEGIDAAVRWPGDVAYFFRGGEYLAYDLMAGAVVGTPVPIADGWPGLFESGIEVALVWPSGNAYFFGPGGEYSQHGIEAGRVSDGYPQPVEGNWPGLHVEDGPSGRAFGTAPASGAATGGSQAGSGTSVRDYFPAFSKPMEGRLPYMYQDVKGLVTVAVGNLIDSPEAAAALPFEHKDTRVRATREEIVAEWHLIKNAPGLAQRGHLAAKEIHTLELSEAAIDDVVRRRFDVNEARLAAFYPGWARWPADARLGAHSIAWTGSWFPDRWPNFNAAAAAGDWAAAAGHSHLDETGNPGLAERNRANHQLFCNAAAVTARGLDPATIHYPATL